MVKMSFSYEVDWKKTKQNIKSRLKGRAYASAFAGQFHLSERSCQNKMNPDNTTSLSISELAIVAKFLGCDILDLLVFYGDSYVAPKYDFSTEDKEDPSCKTSDELDEAMDSINLMYQRYEIRDVYELLLYLPLIDDIVFRDVVFRCCGNLESFDRHYLKKQLAYLHKSIIDSPEKKFADNYRDKVLRVKGDSRSNAWDIQYIEEYLENIERYAKDGNCVHSEFYEKHHQYRLMQKNKTKKNNKETDNL